VKTGGDTPESGWIPESWHTVCLIFGRDIQDIFRIFRVTRVCAKAPNWLFLEVCGAFFGVNRNNWGFF